MTAVSFQKGKLYNYIDYKSWSDDLRYEIIEGTPYSMASPSITHQRIVGRLFTEFQLFLRGKKCEAFISPFDVFFFEKKEELNDVKNIVQPDILVVCDENKLTDKGVMGAPDLIIEVTSPSTSGNDFIKKQYLYEKFGVKEYWILDPANTIVQVYLLENKYYSRPKTYSKEDKIKVALFPDLEIDLNVIFL